MPSVSAKKIVTQGVCQYSLIEGIVEKRRIPKRSRGSKSKRKRGGDDQKIKGMLRKVDAKNVKGYREKDKKC